MRSKVGTIFDNIQQYSAFSNIQQSSVTFSDIQYPAVFDNTCQHKNIRIGFVFTARPITEEEVLFPLDSPPFPRPPLLQV